MNWGINEWRNLWIAESVNGEINEAKDQWTEEWMNWGMNGETNELKNQWSEESVIRRINW